MQVFKSFGMIYILKEFQFKMDIKRGIASSLRLWGIDFVLTIFGLFLFFASNNDALVYLIIALSAIISSYFALRYYFKPKKIKKNSIESLKLSFLFLISVIIPYIIYGLMIQFAIYGEIIIIKAIIAVLSPLVLNLISKFR